MDSITNILDLGEHFWDNKINDHLGTVRVLHYPGLKERLHDNVFRCSDHSDWGVFSLLRQDNTGGLQIKLNNNKWFNVENDFYDFVVNIGDLMMMWTNDRFKSTRHRVIDYNYDINGNKIYVYNQTRQSIAFFFMPNGDTMIETLQSCKNKDGTSKYEMITCYEYLTKKHYASTGVKDEL